MIDLVQLLLFYISIAYLQPTTQFDMRLVSAWKSNFLLFLLSLVGIWSIFVIVNYQTAKQSMYVLMNQVCTDEINEQDEISTSDASKPRSYLKELQGEIEETFRRFKEKEQTFGKAFHQAAVHGKKGRNRRKDVEIKTLLPRSMPECKPAPFLLILIHSTPANFMEREAIRLSWGRPQNGMNIANAGKQLIPRSVNELRAISFFLLNESKTYFVNGACVVFL